MKKMLIFLGLLLIFITNLSLFAGTSNYYQSFDSDTVILNNGRRMLVKVLTMEDGKLKFQKGTNAEILSLTSSDVAQINFENGKKYVNPNVKKIVVPDPTSEAGIREKIKGECSKAKLDAQQGYSGGGSLIITLLVTALLGGIVGLIPAGVFASSQPNDQQIGLAKGNTEEYNDCYREEAMKIRRRSAWTGFGIGLLLAIIIVVALFSR
jgi:hypothetical protein